MVLKDAVKTQGTYYRTRTGSKIRELVFELVAIKTVVGASSTILTTLQGSEAPDELNIERSYLYINSLGGDDTISGVTAVEKLNLDSGADNDRIIFNAEILNSELNLGVGNDEIIIQDFTGTIRGGLGKDSITGRYNRTARNSLIRGEAGNDELNFFNVLNSIINVNSDDDYIAITGAATNSQLYGGRQKDTITVTQATNSLIRGDANADKITIIDNIRETLINGNADDDHIIINSDEVSFSTVYGGQGDDKIDIASDAIYVSGGKGNDDIDLTSSKKHTIYGGTGDDAIDSNSTIALFINAGADEDSITLTGIAANSGIHSIDGGAGDDLIVGTAGKELIDGGTEDKGEDTIDAAGGDDTIYGRAGNDVIKLSSQGNALVHAGSGDDLIEVVLSQLTYNTTIKGESGSDTIAVVGTSADFNMLENNDIAARAFNSISTIETLAFGTPATSYTIAGTKTISLSSKVQLTGIKTIDASYASGLNDDVLVVNASQFTSAADLSFVGSDDKDVNIDFIGGSGNDTLTTGKINEDAGDTLTGGYGEDTFNIIASDNTAVITDLGTGGSDTLLVSDSAKGVVATVKEDYRAPATTSNRKSFADVVLNARNGVEIDMIDATGLFGYVINGGTSSSTLQGSNFGDSISGNSAVDRLYGNKGNDTIEGGGGADIINAGGGVGVIKDAGNGADIITHDVGSALIVYNTGVDTVILKASRAGVYVAVNVAGVRSVDASTSNAAVTLDGRGAGENTVTYTGGSGDDSIFGAALGDLLTGNDGNDTFTGGLSADIINVGNGSNTVVFTGGITADVISGYTADDVGSFDLSKLEMDDAVEENETLDFVTGSNISVSPGQTISMQTIDGAITLAPETNVLYYTQTSVSNAAALETNLKLMVVSSRQTARFQKMTHLLCNIRIQIRIHLHTPLLTSKILMS